MRNNRQPRTVYPCAKINLGLYVTERREDGYHNLQTVFFPIGLCDELRVEEIVRDEDDHLMEDKRETYPDVLELSGIPVAGSQEDNLVMKVLNDLRASFDIPPLRIELCKHIPSGAGLGGGSSDAAFMMCLLNEMFQLGMTDEQMEARVGRLGADCAFFVRRTPTMAEGIGNIFSPIQLSLKGMRLVLVKPDDFVSTREAYAAVCPAFPAHDLQKTVEGDICHWKERLGNDFEKSVFPNHPTIAHIKQQLYDFGAVYAAMSGSGSSVYGIFRQSLPDVSELFTPHFVFTCEL